MCGFMRAFRTFLHLFLMTRRLKYCIIILANGKNILEEGKEVIRAGAEGFRSNIDVSTHHIHKHIFRIHKHIHDYLYRNGHAPVRRLYLLHPF